MVPGRWFIGDKQGDRVVTLVTPKDDLSRSHAGWAAAASENPMVLAPSDSTTTDLWQISWAACPEGPTLTSMLSPQQESDDILGDIERIVHPLLTACADLHNKGHLLGAINPDVLILTDSGYRVIVPGSAADAPRRQLIPGFSCPEHAGHCGGQMDTRSDVFFCGIVLYYVLTRVGPLAESAAYEDRIPSPQIYR